MTNRHSSAYTIGDGVTPDLMHALAPQWEAACKAELRQWEEAHPFPLPGWDGSVWLNRIEERRQRWERHYDGFVLRWWAGHGLAATLDGKGFIVHVAKAGDGTERAPAPR